MDPQFTILLIAALLAIVASWFLLPVPWARGLLAAARKAAGFRQNDIEAAGYHWLYLEAGAGPVLLLVHGFGGDSNHWLRVAPGLGKHFRLVAPDLVGFGRSDPGLDADFDIGAQADRLAGFLDALGIRRCLVAGSSMGGWIATALAASQPERVSALWLLAPLGVRACRKSPILTAVDEQRDSPMQIGSRSEFEHRVVRRMFARLPWFPHPLKVYYGDEAVRRSPRAERMFRQVREESEPLEALAARVQVPVLLQWGERDEAVDVSGVTALEGAFADLEIRVQPGVGHLPMLESAVESLGFFMDFHRRRLAVERQGR